MNRKFITVGLIAIIVGLGGACLSAMNHNWHWFIYDIGMVAEGIVFVIIFRA